jgi:putative salt-induced outer membrane protein YdiY
MKKAALALLLSALAAVAFADDDASKASSTLSLGANLTDGNSDTLALSARFQNETPFADSWKSVLDAEANYGETDDEKSVENAKIQENLQKSLNDLLYVAVDASAAYDDIALLDYRFILGPAAGLHLIASDPFLLDVEVGPSYVWEKLDGETDDYLAIRFAERAAWTISETSKLVQNIEYLPKAEDFDEYLLNAGVSLETKVAANLVLSLSLEDKYTSTPAEGMEENDVSLVASLGLTF